MLIAIGENNILSFLQLKNILYINSVLNRYVSVNAHTGTCQTKPNAQLSPTLDELTPPHLAFQATSQSQGFQTSDWARSCHLLCSKCTCTSVDLGTCRRARGNLSIRSVCRWFICGGWGHRVNRDSLWFYKRLEYCLKKHVLKKVLGKLE